MEATEFQGIVCGDCRGLVMCWPMPDEKHAAFLVDVMRDILGATLRPMTRAAVLALPRCDCIVPGFVAGPTDASR